MANEKHALEARRLGVIGEFLNFRISKLRPLLVAFASILVWGGDAHADTTFVDSFSVAAQETNPSGVAFSSNGLKMFVVGETGNDVNEYDLGTAFDVSTAVFVDSFSVAAQDTGPTGVTFSSNGLKMFVVGTVGDSVHEYDLGTAFDVSTAVFVDSFSVIAQDTNPLDVAFSSNGLKMFVVGDTGDDVNEYDLGTAFDVSTAVFVDSFSVAAQDVAPNGVAFSSNGLKMFVVGANGDDVHEYDLGTAFDVSTAVFVDSFSVAAQDVAPTGVAFSSNGLKMFVVGAVGQDVNEYDLEVAFDLFSSPSENSDDSGGGSGCVGDCTPPTLGVDEDTRRLVTDGFSYNGNPVDVEQYYTPYPLITVQTGKQNTAAFKIYENEGPDNISHFELAFGLAQGQILADSSAAIFWDRTFDGVETVTLNDPQNALDNVNVTSSAGPCDGGTIPCLILTITHTFREPLEFDIVATNVWDSSRNAWQNYYNHGIHVIGESLNPPDQYDGIYKGRIYHLTETGKNAAVDELGNTWSFDYGVWNMDYVLMPRPQDGDWQVFTRYHSDFENYKKGQSELAQKRLGEILGYKIMQKPVSTYVAGAERTQDKRSTDEFYKLIEYEQLRAKSLYDTLYKD
jgi:hypothetical protein